MRRAWDAPLWAHALAYAALLLALVPLFHLEASFTSDEGAYALQVRALSEGEWSYRYPAADLDPEGRFFPIVNAAVSDRGYFPYPEHPAYVLAMAGLERVIGLDWGVHLLALAGGAVAALAAGLLAREVHENLARPALWIAACGPVLVNAYVVWAHAPSAALGGLSCLAAVRVLRSERNRWWVLLVLSSAAQGLLRSEGVLFGLALAIALAIVGRRSAHPRRARWAAVAVALSSLITLALDTWWKASIVGGTSIRGVRQTTGSFVSGRIDAAWAVLGQGAIGDRRAEMMSLVALAVLVVAAFALRRGGLAERRVAVGLAVAAAAVVALRGVTAPTDPATGLFAAWPVAFLGVLGVRVRSSGTALFLAVVTGLFVLAVLATQYAEAGGFEWGGRFLSPATGPVAVLAAAGVERLARRTPALATVAVVLGAAGAFAAAVVLHGVRTTGRERADEVVAAGARVVLSSDVHLPRYAWWTESDLRWLVVPMAEAPAEARSLLSRDVGALTVVQPWHADVTRFRGAGRVEDATGPATRRYGWRLLRIVGR